MKSFLLTCSRSYLMTFGLVFFLLPSLLSAQPLSGAYTIGGSVPDYTTLNTAVTALVSNGVSGPVIFNIAAGIYNERVSIPIITGASATNTITFQSANLDSSTTIIRSTATVGTPNYVFELNGANYIRIKHLTIEPQGLTYQKAIQLKADASNNIISNNILKGTNNSANSYKALIHFYGNYGDNFKHNHILSNRFENGGYQIWIECRNTSTTSTDNPILGNMFTGNSGPAIKIEYQQGVDIRNNTISGYKNATAIHLSRCGSNSIIEKNNVTASSNSSLIIQYSDTTNLRNNLFLSGGISISQSTGVKCYNNFISGGGISISQSTGIKFYNNSCYFAGTGYLFLLNGTSTTASIYNNCFSAPISGSFVNSPQALNNALVQFDRNIYYTTAAAKNFHTGGSSPINFATWQITTGSDANSFLTDPQYFSATDLHINNALLPNGGGQPLPEVTEDIDGEPRDPLTPDIGADEYSIDFATFNDIEMVGEAFLSAPCTPASSVKIKVANHSPNTVTSFTAIQRLFGVLRDSSVYNVTIPPGDTTIVDLGSFSFGGGTQYDFLLKVALPNGSPDNHCNDNEGNFSYAHLAPINIRKRTLECANDIELSIQQQPFSTVLWSTGATTPAIIVSGPGTYAVTITDSSGCTVSGSYIIN